MTWGTAPRANGHGSWLLASSLASLLLFSWTSPCFPIPGRRRGTCCGSRDPCFVEICPKLLIFSSVYSCFCSRALPAFRVSWMHRRSPLLHHLSALFYWRFPCEWWTAWGFALLPCRGRAETSDWCTSQTVWWHVLDHFGCHWYCFSSSHMVPVDSAPGTGGSSTSTLFTYWTNWRFLKGYFRGFLCRSSFLGP